MSHRGGRGPARAAPRRFVRRGGRVSVPIPVGDETIGAVPSPQPGAPLDGGDGRVLLAGQPDGIGRLLLPPAPWRRRAGWKGRCWIGDRGRRGQRLGLPQAIGLESDLQRRPAGQALERDPGRPGKGVSLKEGRGEEEGRGGVEEGTRTSHDL